MRRLIAVDVDDVLAMENEAVRQFANARYGHEHSPEDYLVPGDYWGYWESVQQVDADEGRRRYDAYLRSGVKSRLEVMRGARDALDELRTMYDLVVVTARDLQLQEVTEHWITRHFPSHFQEIIFVAERTGSVKGSKARICRDIGAAYLVDDHPGHLHGAHQEGIQGILFGRYGWSDSVALPGSVHRAETWRHVRDLLCE